MPPTDPLLYRLYEVLLVFGQPIKAVIHEVRAVSILLLFLG